MSVGAVIVTYHTPAEQLARCLCSIEQNSILDHQIVNNDTHNIGFAAAVNQGAQNLTNEYLLFLNPDAALKPNTLNFPLKYISQHPQVGIVGPLLINDHYVCEEDCYGEPINLWSLFIRRLVKHQPPSQPQAVGWVSGGAMLVRRSVFQALSGFDPNFFLYWEDVDLCQRARQAGVAVHLLPSWQVFHQRGASSTDSALKTHFYDKSADNYFRKHYSKPIWLLQRYLRMLYRLVSPVVH